LEVHVVVWDVVDGFLSEVRLIASSLRVD
jgi:hypothetical protein